VAGIAAWRASPRGGHRRLAAGDVTKPLFFGPGGQDVAGELLDEADGPDQQRADGGRVDGLGDVLPGGGGRRQVVVEAFEIPGGCLDPQILRQDRRVGRQPGQRD